MIIIFINNSCKIFFIVLYLSYTSILFFIMIHSSEDPGELIHVPNTLNS